MGFSLSSITEANKLLFTGSNRLKHTAYAEIPETPKNVKIFLHVIATGELSENKGRNGGHLGFYVLRKPYREGEKGIRLCRDV